MHGILTKYILCLSIKVSGLPSYIYICVAQVTMIKIDECITLYTVQLQRITKDWFAELSSSYTVLVLETTLSNVSSYSAVTTAANNNCMWITNIQLESFIGVYCKAYIEYVLTSMQLQYNWLLCSRRLSLTYQQCLASFLIWTAMLINSSFWKIYAIKLT